MKKKVLSAFFMIATGVAINAQAADGTIHFTGSITDQACTVDSNSQNLPVDLGKVALTALNGEAGMRASPVEFAIVLSACPATVTGAHITFDGQSDSTNNDLLALDSDANAATGVGIQITDKDGTPIPLHSPSADFTLAEGSNTLDFIARYVSTGTSVTAGDANATSDFTIVYK